MKNETSNIETTVVAETIAEVKQLGRPVNPNSERQKRLAELEAKRANGELKRGRPAMIKVAVVETPVIETPVVTEEQK